MNRLTKSRPLTEYEAMNLSMTDLYMRLKAYEDTGLEPEQCAKYAQAEKEGRYIVLKEPRSAGVHRLEEIARADIEGRLLVLPCKAADTCKWATRPLTNADRIRAMTDEELATLLTKVMAGNSGVQLNGIWPEKGMEENQRYFTRLNWLDHLKQEVKENV